jgi:hypothetical protein
MSTEGGFPPKTVDAPLCQHCKTMEARRVSEGHAARRCQHCKTMEARRVSEGHAARRGCTLAYASGYQRCLRIEKIDNLYRRT